MDQYVGCIRKNAEEMMDKAMPEADEELFSLYEKTGNRLRYEEVYFTRRKYLAVFGCLAILDGAETYVKKLVEVLKGICAEECWALPAHVHRDVDPDWRVCVDLFAVGDSTGAGGNHQPGGRCASGGREAGGTGKYFPPGDESISGERAALPSLGRRES